MTDKIEKITIKYANTVEHMDIPDHITASLNTLWSNRKIVLDGGIEAILGRSVTVIITAPKDIDTGKIMEAIDNVLNPVKLSLDDLKFCSFDEMYDKWLFRHNK